MRRFNSESSGSRSKPPPPVAEITDDDDDVVRVCDDGIGWTGDGLRSMAEILNDRSDNSRAATDEIGAWEDVPLVGINFQAAAIF